MNEIEKEIYNNEIKLLTEAVRASEGDLRNLLHDAFEEFGSSGKKYDKDFVLENLPHAESSSYAVSDYKTTILADDVVLATFVTERKDPDGGVVISLRSSIWKKEDDRWQLLFHQGTPMKTQ